MKDDRPGAAEDDPLRGMDEDDRVPQRKGWWLVEGVERDVSEAQTFATKMKAWTTKQACGGAASTRKRKVETRKKQARRVPRVQARSAGRDAEVERMQRIVQDCLAAVATGDVDSLEACIAEAKEETKTHETDLGRRAHGVAREAEAEMVLEDCLQAIADGDMDELDACLWEASSAMEGEAET